MVCCGGTGSKVAAKLAELMGQDPYWRHKMDTRMYFLLLDTDTGDMNKNADQIKKAAPPNCQPFIQNMNTTAGYTLPGEIIAEFLRGVETETNTEKKKAAMQRFAEHWWCKNPGAESLREMGIFTIPGITQALAQGAGQVPMVSYLATWISLRANSRNNIGLEDVLRKLAAEIRNREPRADVFNVYLLGSFAGGTGRGSLIPVAFKLKEVFAERLGSLPVVDGYILHSSCFQFDERDNAVATKLNAMTGWSELSTWINQGDNSALYTLPSPGGMDNPALDSVRLERTGTYSSEVAYERIKYPLDQLYVIGPTNQNGYTVDVSSGGDALYTMLGSALYVKITQQTLASKANNRIAKFASVGSSTTEIPANSLELYFRDKSRTDSISALVDMHKEKDKDAQDAIYGSKVLEHTVSEFGLTDAWGKIASHDKPREPENELDVFLMTVVVPRVAKEWGVIHALMEAQEKPEELQDALKKVISRQSFANQDLQQQLAEAYTKLHIVQIEKKTNQDFADFDGYARSVVSNLVERLLPLGGSAESLQSAALPKISGILASLPRQLDEILEQAKTLPKPSPDLLTELENIKGREGFMGVTGAYYSKSEIEGMRRLFTLHLLHAYARALAEGLNAPDGLIAIIKQKLKMVRVRCDECAKAIKVLASKDEYNEEKLEARRNKLFSSKNSLESSLDMDNAVGLGRQNINRSIRPLHPRPDELKLTSNQVRDEIKSVLNQSSEHVSDSVDINHLSQRIEKALHTSRYHLMKKVSDKDTNTSKETWVDANSAFSLAETLRRLAPVWQEYLNEQAAISTDRREEIFQKFRLFFGSSPKLSGDHIRLVDDKMSECAPDNALLLSLTAATLRSCASFWSLQNSAKTTTTYIVIVPKDMSKDKELWSTYLRESLGRECAVEIVPVTDEFNPGLIAVYTSNTADSWEQIATLSDWSDDNIVANVLVESEKADPAHPFNPEIARIWPSYRGSGFAEPRYINNLQYRTARWRPWLSAIEQEKERAELAALAGNNAEQQAKEMLPLLYAIFGPQKFINWALGDDRGKAANESLLRSSDSKCEGPILVEGRNKQWSVGRYAVVFLQNRTDIATDQGFSPEGSKLLQSGVANLKLVLDGSIEPLSGETGRRRDLAKLLKSAIRSEYRTFEEIVAFEHGFSPSEKRQYQHMLIKLKDEVESKLRSASASGDSNDKEFWQEATNALIKLLDK